MKLTRSVLCVATLAALVILPAGCTSKATSVDIDGSSTVFPITEAVAEEFRNVDPSIRVKVGVSGTGGGFKKFCIGETDINDASRPIKESERTKAAENNIEFIELPVAFDGISVVVNRENAFLDEISADELAKIWSPESTVKNWNDVRSEWPSRPIKLYGPGTDSGTFDYFTEAINGKSQRCRSDFTASEDDNVLVRGVSGDPDSLGFFGFAYYKENKDQLKVVPVKVDAGAAAIAPSMASINDGSYQPLSRPIFIYVSKAAAQRPEVKAFVEFYLKNAKTLVGDVGYVPLPDEIYDLALERFQKGITGSIYEAADAKSATLAELLKRGSGS